MFRLDESLALKNFDALVATGELAWSPSEPIYRTVDNVPLEFRICPQLNPDPGSPSPAVRQHGTSNTNSHSTKSGPPRGNSNILNLPSSLFTISACGPCHTVTLPRYAVHRPQYLLLTNDWRESQNVHLNASDLAAAWALLQGAQTPLFVTYNCGQKAGSTSSHKHLQAFPRPSGGVDGMELFPDRPLEEQESTPIPYQYFFHRFTQPIPADDLVIAGQELMSVYFKLLVAASDALEQGQRGSHFTDPFEFPHNVIFVPEWIVVIPRRESHVGAVGANALDMMGMVWVREEDEMDEWEQLGVAKLLATFGVAA